MLHYIVNVDSGEIVGEGSIDWCKGEVSYLNLCADREAYVVWAPESV